MLVFSENGEVNALDLNLDIVGCGKTEREALADLKAATEAQLDFCRKKGHPVEFRSEQKYFRAWHKLRKGE